MLRPIVGSEEAIVLKNPTETAQDSASRLSLWLHHITENEFMKNQPMERGPSHDARRFPPLALNFSFLVTPFASSTAAEHLLLGKAMQVFYDNATILLRDEASDVAEELRLIFCRLNLEEVASPVLVVGTGLDRLGWHLNSSTQAPSARCGHGDRLARTWRASRSPITRGVITLTWMPAAER